MSYPGAPGVSKNTAPPSSLPARPPPSKLSGFKPAFSAPSARYPGSATAPGYSAPPTSSSNYSSAPSYTAQAPGSYGAPPTTSSYSYSQPPTVAGAPSYGAALQSYGYQSSYQQQASYYGANSGSYSTPPQIRNPFPAPSAAAAQPAGCDYDPEMAAQIAQWQSAYMPKDASEQAVKGGPGGRFGGTGANAIGVPTVGIGVSAGPDAGASAAAAAATAATNANGGGPGNEKKKTVFREGGGKKWSDETLLEWDPAHLRLFVGNLAGETTDESLLKAFAQWKSVQKAKVIRDKRTKKSKGYGFVSFSDPDDFFQAAKEMNGKYIQSHPVVVHKAKTEIKPQSSKDDRRGGKNNHKKGNGGGNGGKKSGSGAGGGESGAYEPHLGPIGGGITKPGQKTRGGLKLLG